MSVVNKEFNAFWKQLYSELQSLSSEAKKRNNAIRQASDKSIEILKTVHSYDELSQHPDFVVPFILSCSSNNAKFTTISMQCLQGLASTPCLPQDKLSDVLDGFIDATQLALEIKLKVLQVLPIFFKNYSQYVFGPLCAKLLRCCSNLLHSPNKSSMVVGTASATLQQLIDEIFERVLSEDSALEEGDYSVLVGNNESIKVNAYRFDANRLFSDLCSSFDITDSQEHGIDESFLDTKNLPVTYGLEILESILQNGKGIFLKFTDMQFLLRIKTVPFLLRCISSGKHFSIVLRSFRCINLLMNEDYLLVLELEMEVILSLLIHALSIDSDSSLWKKALSLEIFANVAQNFNLLAEVFMTYDNFPDKKHVITNLLNELLRLLSDEDVKNCLCESDVIEKLDQPIISAEVLPLKIQYIHMLDKSNAPSVNIIYIIWLILTIPNEMSDGLSVATLKFSQSADELSSADHLERLTIVYQGIFSGLFEIHCKFLFSTSLDTPLFHSLIRAFQKLAHAAGMLSLSKELNRCLDLFSQAIVTNGITNNPMHLETSQQSTIFNTLSGSLVGPTSSDKVSSEFQFRRIFPPRNINQRQVSLFRALISLSVSLGPALDSENWSYILKTWQWISYYVYGPSADIMEEFYAQDVPPSPSMTKNEILSVENSIVKLYESTTSYGSTAFKAILEQLISECQCSLFPREMNDDVDASSNKTTACRQIEGCACNRLFYITQIGELAIYNSSRFFTDQKNKETALMAVNYLIELVANRDLPNLTIRLYAAKTFTDIIRKVCFEVGSIEDQDLRVARFHILESVILDSILNCINALKELDVTKNTIHNGVLKAESEILLQLLSALKDILNEFGDIINTSWSAVFMIVNSPFEGLKKDLNDVLVEDESDSSLVNGILQKYKEMIQVSYDVFKLISDDFLQSLPIQIIKIVIDTLLNFVMQELNLNISFSSISQFWLVGDYLRQRKDQPLISNEEKEFLHDIESGRLEEIISSHDAGAYKMYNGLWLYLLKKLIECSEDKRIEVKNGAVQTFFRIVDSHGAFFPDWNLIFLEVIKPLLTNKWSVRDQTSDAEFWNHTFEGLVDLYPSHFTDFSEDGAGTEQWRMLLDFIESYVGSGSTDVAYVAIVNYHTLLKSMLDMAYLPKEVLDKVMDIWSRYNIVYGDLTDNTFAKRSNYDCVQEFIASFPHLYKLIMKYEGVTVEFLEKILSLFNSAVRYPLLPENIRDKIKPSSLQLAVLTGLSTFAQSENGNIEVLILFQLSAIMALPFETKEKIEKKLLPKLPVSSRSRIPSFEAVSFSAFKLLKERLEAERNWAFLTERASIKIMNNLSNVISRKPFFEVVKDSEEPIWIMVSRCFRDISLKMFSVSSTLRAIDQSRRDFCDIFVGVAASILKRIDAIADKKTGSLDAIEYAHYREILLKKEIIQYLDKTQIDNFLTAIWECSFLYEFSEVENEILDLSESLSSLASKLSQFEFADVAGSTTETPILSKYQCSIACLKDLISFAIIPGSEYEEIRRSCSPYLVCRLAFALRRYISNESLVRRAPIPKVRKIELEILLVGLHDILEPTNENTKSTDEAILTALKVLHPLILRTIPLSHKLDVLQKDVLELSLGFTRLISKSDI